MSSTPDETRFVLKAEELRGCPVYSRGDTFRFRMPLATGRHGAQCALPLASFLPIALQKPPGPGSGQGAASLPRAGRIEAGYKTCACRWSYCEETPQNRDALAFEEDAVRKEQLSLSFVQQLPEALAERLLTGSVVMRFQPGETLLKQQAVSEHLHLLQRGRARVSSRGSDGRVFTVAILRKGDCFGEISLLSGLPMATRVDAVDECTVISVPKAHFLRLMEEEPPLSRILFRLLAERLRVSNVKISQLMSPALSGDLQLFGFIDLAQTVHTSRMTGVLQVQHGQVRARFAFADGRLHFAQAGNLHATHALDAVLGWKEGSFRFDSQEAESGQNLSGDTLALLLDALRRLDEATHALVPEGAVLEEGEGLEGPAAEAVTADPDETAIEAVAAGTETHPLPDATD